MRQTPHARTGTPHKHGRRGTGSEKRHTQYQPLLHTRTLNTLSSLTYRQRLDPCIRLSPLAGGKCL
jgi:hypothetical protein